MMRRLAEMSGPQAPGKLRLLPARTMPVRLLAFLFLGAAGCLALAVVFPMSAKAPITLGYVMIAVALAMAAFTYAFGDRLPSSVLLGEAALAAVLNSVIVAFAATTGGVMGDALAYLWIMVYVALFFPEAVGVFAVLVSAGFGIGWLVSGVPGMVTGWALVSLTTYVLGLVVRRVARFAHEAANTDHLTGTLNRSGLESAISRLGGRRRRGDVHATVAVLDLDDFKLVNDRDGHHAGDRLLVDATAAWREALRADDLLARAGGDEFVVLMPRTLPDEAHDVLARLRQAHPVQWSAGTAAWQPQEPFEDAMRRADTALYAAKTERAAAPALS